MKITFVKKVKADGSACRKCTDVEKRLYDNGQMDIIDDVIIADERDPDSLGMRLAKQHDVEQAPFFLVENDDHKITVYTIYFQFVKEVLQAEKLPMQKVA